MGEMKSDINKEKSGKEGKQEAKLNFCKGQRQTAEATAGLCRR